MNRRTWVESAIGCESGMRNQFGADRVDCHAGLSGSPTLHPQ